MICMKEKMRLMNGDSPAVQFEDGNQKRGHYASCNCEGYMRRASEYDYMAYQSYKSLEEKQKLVLSGKFGKYNFPTPFKNLKVHEIRKELKARGTKKELQEHLTEILRGTSQLPALRFADEGLTDLQSLNLQDYEVLCFEPLHTCLNHIANIFTELPLHITDVDCTSYVQLIIDKLF